MGLRGVHGHGGGAMHVGSGGLGGAQAKHRLRGIEEASALYCAQRWAYYNPASGKYMGDDGEWHPMKAKKSGSSRSFLCSTLSMLDKRPE